jgi:pimeloyl-ACP methyl ester carboxylesterase
MPITDAYGDPTWLQHGRVKLALHRLDDGDRIGRPLLLLHELGGQSPDEIPGWAKTWAGPVYALDFTGHGRSNGSNGGGYTAEILIGDVDAALARIGPSTVVGHGLGAYVALLIAGARPSHVVGAVLADGAGLAGGGVQPRDEIIVTEPSKGTPDPWALVELANDPRPTDYALRFTQRAVANSSAVPAIAVSATEATPWLDCVRAAEGVDVLSITEALERFAS